MVVPLATRVWGSSGRRILLLHGITSNAAGWWRLGRDLAAEGFAVSAVDLRGHGSSPRGDEYSMGSYAADVLAMESGWEAVIGHSLGGAVAVVASNVDPAFARSLILQDPALVMGTADRDEVTRWLLEPFDRPATPEAVAAANPAWHARDVAIKAEALGQTGPDVVSETIADNWPWQFLDAAAALTVPTLLLASDPKSGGIVPITIADWLVGENPFVSLEVLWGAGHSAHRETDHYAAYLDTIGRTLRRMGSES